MRWALRLGALAFGWAAASEATAQGALMCRTDGPTCGVHAAAAAGSACTCVANGVAVRGHVVVSLPSSYDWSEMSRRFEHSTRGIHPTAPDLSIAPLSPIARPPSTVAANTRPLQPARALRLGTEIPDARVGAYGVLALSARATADSQARLGRLCQAFLASLPPQSSLPATVPLEDQMLTYWPVTRPLDEQCDAMLADYDLFAGQRAIRDAAAHGSAMGDRGPYLVGWSPSTSREVPDAVVLVVDLSNLESERSFTEAFRFWQERVVQDPSLWRNGFSMVLVRSAARDFADRYGSEILKALHLSSD